MLIRPYEESDESQIIELWHECELTRSWNDPRKDIARKLNVQRELFLVGTISGQVVASVMAGYEGHRGWVNYLAVGLAHRGHGYASALMRHVEQLLLQAGCPKINLQVRASNSQAIGFYQRTGYSHDEVVSYGKRLIPDEPAIQLVKTDVRSSDQFQLTTDIDSIDWLALASVFERAPLGKRDPKILEQLFRNSGCYCFAFLSGELVGAGRALTDGINYAFVLDVVLLPEHQGKGYGAGIMRFLIAASEAKNIVLHSVPGKEGFYSKLGYRKMITAMALFADPDSWQERGYIE